MCSGSPKVPVNDDHGDQDGDGVHDEGEEQVLGYEGQDERSRRQNLRYEQEEDNE